LVKVFSLAFLAGTFLGLGQPALSASLEDALRRLEAVEAENKALRSRSDHLSTVRRRRRRLRSSER
jgi:hypothetical protein